MKLRVGTRGSVLALSQTKMICGELEKHNPQIELETKVVKTTGDKEVDRPFSAIGGRGLFTRELDEALAKKDIDLAVHSLKDLTSEFQTGIMLGAVTAPVDPRDAVVSKNGTPLHALARGAVVGTASLRRGAQIRSKFPHLEVKMLRGNVDTRLRKVKEGEFDAIVIAAAGLVRLGRADQITEYLDPKEFVPAMGQGRLAITCRTADMSARHAIEPLNDPASHRMARIERILMQRLEGGCLVPLGCFGEEKDGEIVLYGFLALPDGTKEIRKSVRGSAKDADALAETLSEELLRAGGKEILETLRSGAQG